MNRRSFLTASLAGLAGSPLLFRSSWAASPVDLPVICYHQVHPDAHNEMITTPERFIQQLDYFAAQGYHTVSLQQANAYLKGKAPQLAARKPLLLTFDDGYDGVYKYALPELKKRKMTAVVFLVVGQMGKPGSTPHLTREQIEEMAKSGVFEFGSHTWDMHIKIPEDVASGRVSHYALWNDLVKSRKVIKEWTGQPGDSFAWPYGHYDETTLKIAKKAGFRMIFGTEYGKNFPASGCDKIRRIRLSSVYDTVEVLRRKLQ